MSGVSPAEAATPDAGRADALRTGADGQADTPESLAIEAAKKGGKPVDVPSMRSEFGEVTARPDGTLESVTHTRPVRTRKDGRWVDIDPTLRITEGGMVEPKAVLSGLAFSGGGDQPLVRMEQAGKNLELSWPKPLPEPRLNGPTALYRSVLPGVDLQLTATRTGFNQLLVVKTKEAAQNPELAELRLGLDAKGLAIREAADGSLRAVDEAAGGTVFTAPRPMMYDSSAVAKEGPGITAAPMAKSAPGSPTMFLAAGAAHAAPVGIEVTPDGAGTKAENTLVLTPAQSLLDDPRTVYPVVIDPAWDTPHASAWAGISRSYSDQPYYKFTYNSTYVSDFGTGYCASPGCSTADVKRVFYRVPVTSKFSGKHILSAEFNVWESHSYNCTAKPVQLYLTKGIGTGTTWSNSTTSGFWAQWLQTMNAAKGWGSGCAAGYLEFGGTSGPVKDLVQRAASGAWPNITFGLKAENESDPGAWKRFSDDASLRVRYNLPPKQPVMSDLTMSPGSSCSSSTVRINRLPQVTAKVYDPDGEQVGAQIAAAWDAGDGQGFRRRWWSTGTEGTAPTTLKSSGSPFSVTLPAAVPKNKTVGWEARGWDGAEWGLWSSAGDKQTDCYFHVDTTAPDGPVISSVEFPGDKLLVNPGDVDNIPPTNGVGKYGTFTFDSVQTDVVKYEYGIDTDPSAAFTKATTAGAPQSMSTLVNTPGPHRVTARAIDGSGNASQVEVYYFNALGGDPQRAGWAMDEPPGAGSVAGSADGVEGTLGPEATSITDGHSGRAVSMEGTDKGYVSTGRAVLDTNRSFSMSVWAKPTAVTAGMNRAAIAQLGQHQSITLGLLGDKWVVKTPTADGMAGYSWYTAASTTSAVAGEWTHLAAVYDATAKTLTLYVDGKSAATVTGVSMWQARGELTFGRMKWLDTSTDAWIGALDDGAVWSRALNAAEVSEVANGRPLTAGLPAKAAWTFDEEGNKVSGRPELSDLNLYGAQSGVPGISGNVLKFDGSTSYARTSRPQVDGTRSFSVSTWVRMPTPAVTDKAAKMIVTQNGVQQNEFSLYYSAADKKWKFGRYTEDAATANLVVAVQPACTAPLGTTPCFGDPADRWTHLIGVWDANVGRLRLFVNGYQVAEAPYTQAKPWATPGPLQIGAVNRAGANGEFLKGEVDDVRVFDRVVTAAEARELVQQQPQIGSRWRFDSATGTPLTSPDEAGKSAENAVLTGATINPGGGYLGGAGKGSLMLDGVDDYAATAQVPVHTGQSFTVAGWAQTAADPTRDMTLLSIAGSAQSAVEVGWDDTTLNPGTAQEQHVGQWRVSVTDKDGTAATRTSVLHTFDPGLRIGGWNHIAVVYDGFADRVSLYVNGVLEDQTCSDEEAGTTCTEHVSWATVAQPFDATGQVQFGRLRANSAWGSYFSGEIDDVWMYQGALSPAAVISLADPNVDQTTPSGA
ncbi:LamG-like jellyroll fold domain-containing protein [Streptomyces sp. NPDC048018]|uniref:LamG-like jellyroll fold domain-containing protein n=1 Tax=Streptomyces sp. NPDC048018 TaxID=3365499 RepID=UPI003724A44E